jgi:hypothetical protein
MNNPDDPHAGMPLETGGAQSGRHGAVPDWAVGQGSIGRLQCDGAQRGQFPRREEPHRCRLQRARGDNKLTPLRPDHSAGCQVKLVMGHISGLAGMLFVDFGEAFEVTDKVGPAPPNHPFAPKLVNSERMARQPSRACWRVLPKMKLAL